MKQEIYNSDSQSNEISRTISSLKEKGQKIIFTNGCFDILHLGHLKYLEEAKALGDKLVIGLNSDSSVKKLKGPLRPIVPEMQRAQMLLGLKPVDMVILFSAETPLDLIKLITPDVLVKGGDWSTKEIVGGDWVTAHGGKVKSLRFEKGHSSTDIIEKILNTGAGNKK